MEDFKRYLKAHTSFNEETNILAIALDNPAVIPPEKLRYDVGLIVEDGKEIRLNTRKIDDGKYAIYEVEHTKDGVIDFWNILPILSKKIAIDYTKPIIERYTMPKINNHVCEVCIPLK